MKKKKACGLELHQPHLVTVSCPHCGIVFGRGAFLNTLDPCFDSSWEGSDYVVIEGVRIDRNGALASRYVKGTLCQNCPVNRRVHGVGWPEELDRRIKPEKEE